MNKFSRDYYIYKVLLESNLTTQQRESLLMNEGFKDVVGSAIDKVKGFFGFGKKAKKLGAGGEVLAKNPEFVKSVEALKKPLGAAINNMTQIAQKMNIPNPKSAAAAIITQILNDEGVTTSDIANPQPIEAPGKGSTSSEKQTSGAPIKPDSPNAAASLIQGAAEAQGTSGEKAKAAVLKAEEQNVTPQRAAKLLGNAVASTSGVPAKDCVMIVSALMDAGKLNTGKQTNESLRASTKDLLAASREIEKYTHLYERWQELSHASLLLEAKNKLPNQIKNDLQKKVEDGGFKSGDELKKAIDGLKRKYDVPKNWNDSLFDILSKKIGTADAKTTAVGTANASEMPVGNAAAEQVVKKAQEEFSTTFSLLVKKLKGQVDPGNIGKVLVALDDLESLDVQKG